MIHVDRNRVPMPSVLGPDPDSLGKRELKEAAEFYADPESERRQRRFRFKAYMDKSVMQALTELFHGKCAYCETRITDTAYPEIEHYRPEGGVIGEKGEYYPDLYWWLANEWTNLLIACSICNRAGFEGGKGSRFPLRKEAKRAIKPGDEKDEEPLLLNPCVNYPEKHLVFADDGRVFSETIEGKTTITLLDLNREPLVAERREVVQSVVSMIKEAEESFELLKKFSNDSDQRRQIRNLIGIEKKLTFLMEQTNADQEYAGLKRQLIEPKLARFWKTLSKLEKTAYVPPPPPSWEEPSFTYTKAMQKSAKRSFREYQKVQADYSLKDEEGLRKYRLQRPLVEWIEIHNIKCIRHLKLDLIAPHVGKIPWLMILGENSTGKSTILQSIALVLVGPDYFAELISKRNVNPSEYIRKGTKSGYVKVQLTGFPKHHKLTIMKEALQFTSPLGEISEIRFRENQVVQSEGKGWTPQTLVLGYGATRLLPRTQEIEDYGGNFGRVDNLFHPFVPLVNARRWLLGLPEDKFDYTARRIKELLSLGERDELVRHDNRVWLKAHKTTVPLESLGDGYQTVIALAADILEIVLREKLWPTPEDAHGIVLLDEIGSHLHPTWKMQIVSNLRKFLSGIQFIVTTHQPLCLRGLDNGEVVVMRRDKDDRIFAVTDLPPVKGLRVDQLLTSEYFGLNSTLDPEIDKMFNEYYQLLSLAKLSKDQEKRLKELQRQVEEFDLTRMRGATRRQRLMLQAIDLALAREEKIDLEEIGSIEDETQRIMKDIWAKLRAKESS